MPLQSTNTKNQLTADAYNQIVMNIYMDKLKNGHKAFTVCGCSQKAGATAVSREIAAYFAKTGWKTLLVDMDFRKENQTSETKRPQKSPALTDYISENIPAKEIIQQSMCENMFLIEAGQTAGKSAAELLCSARIDQLISEIYSEYDFIMIDTPSLASYPDAKIISAKTDAVLLVAAFYETSKKTLESIKKQLDAVHASVAGIIITKERRQARRTQKGNKHES